EAQRKRATMAKIRNIALVAVSILAGIASWLYWTAEQQRKQADLILASATDIIAANQMNVDTMKQALAVFQTGADHGHAVSMANLGLYYARGQAVAQDYAKAREWFEKAANKGLPAAMVELGALYENGHGVTRNYGRAREWYEKAATKGYATAMAKLGGLHHNGHGVP